MSRYWNDKVKEIEPYVPGEQPKDKQYIKLNTNENPYPPSKKVMEAMKNAVNDDLKLYPDPTCSDLINEISNYYNLNKYEVFIGNGSDVGAALKAGNNIRGALIGPGVHASHGMERTHYSAFENTVKLLYLYLIKK